MKSPERIAAEKAYDAALAVWREACKKYNVVRHAYHKRTVGDDEFLAARKEFHAASDRFDAQENEFIRRCEQDSNQPISP